MLLQAINQTVVYSLPYVTMGLLSLGLLLFGFFASTHATKDFPPREQSDQRWWLLLILIFFTALGLRAYPLDFGLPLQFHSDEPNKAQIVYRMYTEGSLNPNYFLHPSLLLYSALGVYHVLQAVGVNYLPEFPLALCTLSGRLVSCLAGSASIILLGFIGRRLISPRAGLLAAAILAVSPLHVTCSRYFKEDALFLFFFLGTVFFLIQRQNRSVSSVAAGVCAGLCASSKYTGFLAFPLLTLAPLCGELLFERANPLIAIGRLWVHRLTILLSMFCGALAFFAASPFILLNSEKFLRDFNFERRHMEVGHAGSVISAWDAWWSYHLSHSLVPGMTWPVIFGALVGLGLALRRFRNAEALIVGLFLLIYLPSEWVKAKPAPQPERYVVACLPFLALSLALLLESLKRYRLLALSLVCFPLLRSGILAYEAGNDTRLQMGEWMNSNIAPNSVVLINGEGYSLGLPRPQFQQKSLSRERPQDFEPARLVASGADYLLVSSLMYDRYISGQSGPPAMRYALRRIFQRLPLVREVSAPSGSYGFHNPTLKLFHLKGESPAERKDSALDDGLPDSALNVESTPENSDGLVH